MAAEVMVQGTINKKEKQMSKTRSFSYEKYKGNDKNQPLFMILNEWIMSIYIRFSPSV